MNGLNGLNGLSVPAAAVREGERETEQIVFFRTRTTEKEPRWISSSEMEFPRPYTIIALESHYADLLGDLRNDFDKSERVQLSYLRQDVLTMTRRVDGAWVVLSDARSRREKLGRVLVAFELLRGSKSMSDYSTDGRVPLEHMLKIQPQDLIEAGEVVDFAYVLSVFEDPDGHPSGWAYRATSEPNRFELLGVLAVEIDELKEAIRNADEGDEGDD